MSNNKPQTFKLPSGLEISQYKNSFLIGNPGNYYISATLEDIKQIFQFSCYPDMFLEFERAKIHPLSWEHCGCEGCKNYRKSLSLPNVSMNILLI
jgi:hypothetical protein